MTSSMAFGEKPPIIIANTRTHEANDQTHSVRPNYYYMNAVAVAALTTLYSGGDSGPIRNWVLTFVTHN